MQTGLTIHFFSQQHSMLLYTLIGTVLTDYQHKPECSTKQFSFLGVQFQVFALTLVFLRHLQWMRFFHFTPFGRNWINGWGFFHRFFAMWWKCFTCANSLTNCILLICGTIVKELKSKHTNQIVWSLLVNDQLYNFVRLVSKWLTWFPHKQECLAVQALIDSAQHI